MTPRVGIEALAVAVPRRYLDIEDLARARGVDPAKFTSGLGAREMAVADPGEDAVALAATAAAQLIRQHGVDVSKVGMLVVGTETGVDHAKPVASFVQGLLDLPGTMRTYDCQHACYGATAALMASAEWIASGAAAGRSAIVIATDVARYGLGTAGEPTQGAGAVALLVSTEPDLLDLDIGVSGAWSAHVHDFWRPLGRREALVDGHYSIGCYLDALAGAYRGWRERALSGGLVDRAGALASEQLSRILYHVPFCKMARKAHARLRRVDLEHRLGGPLGAQAEAAEALDAQQSFDAQVAPSLVLSARVGNAYTASLYLALAGLLDAQGDELGGQRIGLFSYGSGCASEFFSGVVGRRAAQRMAASGIGELLSRRERVPFSEYERMMGLVGDAPPSQPPAPGTFRFAGIEKDQRQYAKGPALPR